MVVHDAKALYKYQILYFSLLGKFFTHVLLSRVLSGKVMAKD